MTRITQRSIQESTLANLQRNLQGMAAIQEQLSSQKRINRPSDDPTGTVSALTLRADLRANEQHRRNADDGNAWLTTTDSTLQTATSQLNVANTLVIRGLNSGANGPEPRAALAVEVDGIKSSLLGLARTQYLGRNIFAGTAGGSAIFTSGEATDGPTPTTATTYTWSSATGKVERQVASDSKVRVDTPGEKVFGTGETSVFAVLDRISAQLKAGDDTGLAASKLELDGHMATIRAQLADVGARQNRVEYAQDQSDARVVSLNTSLSQVESIDLPATIVQLQSQQVAYQAALGATAKVLQPSLMDFLR